jgi:hypothetical protein
MIASLYIVDGYEYGTYAKRGRPTYRGSNSGWGINCGKASILFVSSQKANLLTGPFFNEGTAVNTQKSFLQRCFDQGLKGENKTLLSEGDGNALFYSPLSFPYLIFPFLSLFFFLTSLIPRSPLPLKHIKLLRKAGIQQDQTK